MNLHKEKNEQNLGLIALEYLSNLRPKTIEINNRIFFLKYNDFAITRLLGNPEFLLLEKEFQQLIYNLQEDSMVINLLVDDLLMVHWELAGQHHWKGDFFSEVYAHIDKTRNSYCNKKTLFENLLKKYAYNVSLD